MWFPSKLLQLRNCISNKRGTNTTRNRSLTKWPVNKPKDARFYSTSNTESAKKMIAMANSYIQKNGLVKLMSVKEDDQDFAFYVKKGSNSKKVSTLVMVIDETMNVGNPEALVMKISGDIDLGQISKITKMINVPGQKQIEKATKE